MGFLRDLIWALPQCRCTARPDTGTATLQVYSANLGQVVDIVVSHQGVEIKTQLIGQLMSALVLPAPEHYRPLLRRLAALSESCACLSWCMLSAAEHMHCSQAYLAVTCHATPILLGWQQD